MTTDPPAQSWFPISPPQLTILVVCVVTIYFIIGFYGKSAESYRIDQRANEVRRQIAQLEEQNQALQEKVAVLATDAFIETTARDKLNLVRPGDHSLIVVPAEVPVAWVESPQAPSEPGRPWSEFGHVGAWLELFFGER